MSLEPENKEVSAARVVFDEISGGPAGPALRRRLQFTNPCRIVQAHSLAEVLPALREIDQAVQDGLWAAGFVAYEAAPAFDRAMETHPPTEGLPLLWFGLYAGPADGARYTRCVDTR